jgi:hypothetical protein
MIFLFFLLIYLFGGFILCVYLGLFLGRKTSSVLVGIAAFCACFALLYGNEIYEDYKWRNLCKTAGNYVYKTIETNSLFYDDRPYHKETYKRNLEEGYEFIEGRLSGYKFDRQQIMMCFMEASARICWRGSDIYLFQLGNGRDTVVDTLASGDNVLHFGASIDRAEIRVTPHAQRLEVRYGGLERRQGRQTHFCL